MANRRESPLKLRLSDPFHSNLHREDVSVFIELQPVDAGVAVVTSCVSGGPAVIYYIIIPFPVADYRMVAGAVGDGRVLLEDCTYPLERAAS